MKLTVHIFRHASAVYTLPGSSDWLHRALCVEFAIGSRHAKFKVTHIWYANEEACFRQNHYIELSTQKPKMALNSVISRLRNWRNSGFSTRSQECTSLSRWGKKIPRSGSYQAAKPGWRDCADSAEPMARRRAGGPRSLFGNHCIQDCGGSRK